ncbi:MAG: IMP dehydrogenase [Deltaproteobacteria bacterium]|nr:IMP dehydrogenase [Deltaproteobacteria bacterium]
MARSVRLEPSRTLGEFRLLCGLTTRDSTQDRIDLRSPLFSDRPGSRAFVLNTPVLAAAMQAVSGPAMGIEMARLGGAAVLFCSQNALDEAKMVRTVKNHRAGFVEPRTVAPSLALGALHALHRETGFSNFPVVDPTGRFLGMIGRRDYDMLAHASLAVSERMIPRDRLDVGVEVTDLPTAHRLLVDGHQAVLPIVDREDRLLYLVFRKDIQDHFDNPAQVVDEEGRLLCLAAINTLDYEERAPALVEAGADALVIDSSDGHSVFQAETLEWIAARWPDLPVMGGNIITEEGFRFLVAHGARAVKVGMGSGSICITQEQKGTGRGLATAIMEVAAAREQHRKTTGVHIPIVADGGLVTGRDVVTALALGADAVMMGRYLARMEESPTEKVQVGNRIMKPYWGEGSARARDWKAARYAQTAFVEGVEGLVEYAGRLRDELPRMLAKIRAAMASAGCATLRDLHELAELELVSALSIREGKVHDIYTAHGDGELPDREE